MSVEVVRRVRVKYPTPLGERHGEFLIEVARALGGGAGLLKKTSGTKVRLPAPFNQDVSQDVVVYKTSEGAVHYDILRDGEGDAEPVWNLVGPVDPTRYLDVSAGSVPDVPAPPLPLPVPVPPQPARPRFGYEIHTPLCAEIAGILDSEGSPYRGNGRAIGECVGHLVWKVQFEGYPIEAARENARKRARNEPAD